REPVVVEGTLRAVDDVTLREPAAHAQGERQLLVVGPHVGVAEAVHAAVRLIARQGARARRRHRAGIEAADRTPQCRDQTVREPRRAARVVRAREVALERPEGDVVLERVVAPDPVHQDVAIVEEEAAVPLGRGIELRQLRGGRAGSRDDCEQPTLITLTRARAAAPAPGEALGARGAAPARLSGGGASRAPTGRLPWTSRKPSAP